MNTYETIKPWLEKSQRNEFFFRNAESFKALGTLPDEYRAVYTILRDALEKPMTRDHYLDWRRAWRATYAKLSAEIRWSKNARKTSEIDDSLAARNAYNARVLRDIAAWFMTLRATSKERAREAYEIAKADRLAA